MKKVILAMVFSIMISCNEKKTEFIQSKVTSNLFLIKNIPTDDSLLKNDIINFLIKNPTEYEKRPFHINFYRYTSKTKYFLDNVPDYSGGFVDENLTLYEKDQIASFIVSKCENDSSRVVGEFQFYDNFFKTDTIIYNCN